MAYQISAGKIAFEQLVHPYDTPPPQAILTKRLFYVLKHTLGLILIPAIIIFCIFFYTWQRVQILRLGYAIEKLENHKSEASLQHKQLRIELAALKSPANLERMAQQRLGMVRPKVGQVVFLSPKPAGSEAGSKATGVKKPN